jgi:glutamate---cysteine ligase / carboxylate-amine ligase
MPSDDIISYERGDLSWLKDAVRDRSAPLTLGAEEEFHIVDLDSRELVPRAPELLARLPEEGFSPELHRSCVETNTPVCQNLDQLRDHLHRLRVVVAEMADTLGLGIIAAGTVPLIGQDDLAVTPTARYERMADDYQLLAREQLICGAQVHVGLPNRDVAVIVAQRVAPFLPVLLALSASSPYWRGQDSGYASLRSLLWQRWPTAGASDRCDSAADHDALVQELIASGTITDPAMIYFDVRPSAHVPTLELRVSDACPSVDDVVLLAGLFRALVRRERDDALDGIPRVAVRGPLLRAAIWRAARSGLEGDLVELTGSARPIPAAAAVRGLVERLRPQLEFDDSYEQIAALAERALSRGSAADRQRRSFARRGRFADVVDMLLEETRDGRVPFAKAQAPSEPLLANYAARLREQTLRRLAADGDEAIDPAGEVRAPYRELIAVLERAGAAGMRECERARDAEQRAHQMTFRVSGEQTPRLFPVDLVPRTIAAEDWEQLGAGLVQRARALDAFLRDVYSKRQAIADGVLPASVVDAAPGLLPLAALLDQPVRAHIAGMDLVHTPDGRWAVLEDNLRVPSGLGYAMQNRRLSDHVWPDLGRPANLLGVEDVPAQLLKVLSAAAPARARSGAPQVALLSQGPADSAWFEHQLLAEEAGILLVRSTDLIVDRRVLYAQQRGRRRRIDVLYLRIDESSLVRAPAADGHPLGVPLMTAVGARSLALVNALGNGVGDDKAVYAFVPALIEYYLHEQPKLACVPTYLCADPAQCAEVLERLAELVVKPVDGYGGQGVLIGPCAERDELAAARTQILAAPHRWIAQETQHLSTHPVFDGTRLTPRHVDLRAFVFLTESDAWVAPAALTRVAPEGSLVVNSSRGGGSKDTWILKRST